MSFRPEHEIYRRRLGRNVGLGLTLAAFVVFTFFLTVVKVTNGAPMEALHKAKIDAAAEAAAKEANQ